MNIKSKMAYTTTLTTEWISETNGECTNVYSHSIPINNYEDRELINNKNNLYNKNAALTDIIKKLKSVDSSAMLSDKCIDFMCNKRIGPFDPSISDSLFTLKNLRKINKCDDKTIIPKAEVTLIEEYNTTFKKKIALDGAVSWDHC